MRFVAANGGVAHFADEGPRVRRAVVFINSLGTDFRIWGDVAEAIARQRRVILYDKRGHGLSTHAQEVGAIADFSLDLAALLDRLNVETATIVGVSIGGLIAQELYRLRPDLVASLVLCDTGHKIGTRELFRARVEAIEKDGIESIAEGIMQRWFSSEYRKNYPDMMAGWRAMLTRTPQRGYIAACLAIGEADLTEGAKAIRAPTLVIVGDEDGSTPPALAREMTALIPGAKLEIIQRAGHLPCIERPEVVCGLIEAHLEEIVT
ncbi:MAG TPA: 3-oxoadipate enol-lactonase [Roseiarcus sp.]|nr:3-oxoadipate enol-lactonase [Roseiarcus sp.]